MKFAAAVLLAGLAIALRGQTSEPSAMIQTLGVTASHPYFVPTHPRVTTTIRFPKTIGPPDGSVTVFTEDASKPGNAEYLVAWQNGDSYLTITPLKDARIANLNVPYEGKTVVFYFFSVSDPLKAVAALDLTDDSAPAGPETKPRDPPPATTPAIARTDAVPPGNQVSVTAARLVGFLDRLKLIHATPPGAKLEALAGAMNVEIAIAHEELVGDAGTAPGSLPAGVSGEIARGVTEGGLYQIVLLRAVRDSRLNCIGFICLLRNESDQALCFDVSSFGARAGAEYLTQVISDASPTLKPHEQTSAYFVVAAPRNSPLSAVNDWRISVDLVSPLLNPGAAIAGKFGRVPPNP